MRPALNKYRSLTEPIRSTIDNARTKVASSARVHLDYIRETSKFEIIMATLSVMVMHFIVIGQLFSFGFLVPVFMEQFPSLNATTNITSISPPLVVISGIGTLQMGMFFVVFGVVNKLPSASEYPQVMMVIGTVLWFIGMLSSAFVLTHELLFLTIGVLAGTGASLVFWYSLQRMSVLELPNYCIGLAIVGGALGQIAFSMGISKHYTTNVAGPAPLKEEWRVALLILACVGALLLLLSIGILSQVGEQHNESKQKLEMHTGSIFLLMLSVCLSNFASFVPFVHLVPFIDEQPWGNPTMASTVLMCLAIGSIAGRLASTAFCYLVTEKLVWIRRGYAMMLLLNTCSLFGWLGVTSFEGAIAFAVFFGFGAGGTLTILLILLHEISGEESGYYLSWTALVMVPGSISGGIIVGAIHDSVGVNKYYTAIISVAVIQLCGWLASIFYVYYTENGDDVSGSGIGQYLPKRVPKLSSKRASSVGSEDTDEIKPPLDMFGRFNSKSGPSVPEVNRRSENPDLTGSRRSVSQSDGSSLIKREPTRRRVNEQE